MFVCEYCSRSFARKYHLRRHGNCKLTVQVCKTCEETFSSKRALEQHQKEKHRASKRQATPSQVSMAKKARLVSSDEPSTSGLSTQQQQHCNECQVDVPVSRWVGHLRTQKHRENCCVVQEEGVELIKTSFRNRIATYRLSTSQNPTNVFKFLEPLQDKFESLLSGIVQKYEQLKVGVELFGRFLLQANESSEVKSFNTRYVMVNGATDLRELFGQFAAILDRKYSEFSEKDSGWALQRLLHLELGINKINPLKASSYIPLPKEIEAKKAVLNIQNTDQKCFMWSVLAALHPLHWSQNANRVVNYLPFESELDFTGMEFPIKSSDISKFERLNNISINVYGLEKVYDNAKNIIEVVGPVYFTTSRKERHVNLLVISDDYGNNHYCLIRSMSRLISSQLSKHKTAKYLCDGCLTYFYSDQKLKAHQEHDCGHVAAKVPTTDLKKNKYGEEIPENILKFTSFEKKLKVPFVVYADFETILEPLPAEQNERDLDTSYTMRTHKHVPYSFAYYIKCDFDDTHSKYQSYRGQDAHKEFVKRLEVDCKSIYNRFMKVIVSMLPMTAKQENEHQQATTCHICEKPFDIAANDRVHDHDHLTGRYSGPAHSVCNLNYKIPQFIPIFFHNMSNFEAHLFVKELAGDEEKLDVIPQNKEKYISFTKHVLVDSVENKEGKQRQVFLKLRFLDSFRFMATGLDKLSQNLKPEQCKEVRKYFPEQEKFELIRQKGVFPYNYVDSFSKLDETLLPSHKHFYNKLKNEDISTDDYKRAWKVWNLFRCKTLGEYSDIYLKSDVLILTDVFESFRDVCLSTYGLDPAQFFTAPGLSFSAALKATSIELELLTDLDMVHFFKHGIRGGVSQCSIRKAFANNKFTPKYDASKPNSYIMYLDATNLYGAAMSQYLPTGNFKWLDELEIQNLDYRNIAPDAKTGYVLEVDLDYPEELHYLHNELPFCPESIAPPNSKFPKIIKLIPNFNPKKKYIIHYQNLRQALDYGLKLTKIHRVLSFNQSSWLKKYIDLNTAMRNQAKNKFEKDFFKLMNNAVFGKTMENVEKRVDVKLVSHLENVGRRLGAGALIAKPHFKDRTIFNENLIAIQMKKQKVTYDKPIYVGFAILEISKTIMYDFLYGYIKPKYGNNAELLYTDTDSLVLKITTENFYDDITKNLNRFDTSNYSQDNQHNVPVNSSILGKMKDEYAGKIIWDFFGTGAKAYCVNVEGECTKKAKGVPDYVTKKELTLEDYRQAVDVEGTQVYRQMNTFRSHSHDMYIELQNKVALSHADDKRFIIPDSEYTLAWGHRDLVLYKESSENS